MTEATELIELIDFEQYDRNMALGLGGRRLLLKAIGMKPFQKKRVLDATAGLARDAFFMAKFGASVSLVERSLPLAKVLGEALLASEVKGCKNMILLQGDAVNLIPTLPAFDVIYLDPMFADQPKKAKVKKDLQVLQHLHRDEIDNAVDLLRIACLHAKERVVVKRSLHQAALLGPVPNWSLKGKTVRFDVYSTHARSML